MWKSREKSNRIRFERGIEDARRKRLRNPISVRQKNIGFCQHCDYCLKKKECRIKDEMYELYPLLKEAKGNYNCNPIYNGGVSAQIKAVMDRCRTLVAADYYFFK